jgi:hypothetical protein
MKAARLSLGDVLESSRLNPFIAPYHQPSLCFFSTSRPAMHAYLLAG